MIKKVRKVLIGAVDRNWCFDNDHEIDDHLVDETSVAVNNSLTQDIHQTNHIPLCSNIIHVGYKTITSHKLHLNSRL